MELSFSKIIGQGLAVRVLRRAVSEGKPARAYLFLGLEGTGKLTTAIEFGKGLNCEDPRDGNACGECAICHAVEHENFPDMRVWSKTRQVTSIDSMREMRDQALLKPLRGRWMVNIVEEGDTLNEEAASCILKLLEEPPPHVVNILLYRNAANVMPTIRSRCQLVRFGRVEAGALTERLIEEHGADPSEAAFLATYSQGRPGIAIRLIGDQEFRRRRESVAAVALAAAPSLGKRGLQGGWAALALAEALRSKAAATNDGPDEDEDEAAALGPSPSLPRGGTADAAARSGARQAASEALDMLLIWYRDLIATKLQGENAAVVNSDMRAQLLEQSARYPHAGPLLTALEAILRAKRRVQGNAVPQIVTEALMVRLTR